MDNQLVFILFFNRDNFSSYFGLVFAASFFSVRPALVYYEPIAYDFVNAGLEIS